MAATRRGTRTANVSGTNQRNAPRRRAVATWLHWHHPLGALCLATAAYVLLSAIIGNLFESSGFALFNYQAKAFLDGQLHLTEMPPSLHDLSYYKGKFHLYWQPFPAVVLMPFVALFGTGFSDILFNILVAGLNVALVAALLRRAVAESVVALDERQRGLLVMTFALGSVHLPLAVLGRVWFTAQLVAFACVALAYLASVTLRGPLAFLAVGAAIGAATLSRSHAVFAGLWPALFLILRWLDERRRDGARWGWWPLLGRGALLAAPVLAAVGLFLLFNLVRFGDPLETGISHQRMDAFFRPDFERWGVFNLHYLPTNIFYQYVYYPFPLSPRSLMGGSLFLLTPVFAAAFWAFRRPPMRWSPWVLAACVALVATPIMLLMGTGWAQWGPRYTLDFTVPLLLLVAGGLGRWPIWVTRAALAVSVAHYVVGALFLARFFT